MIWLLPHMSVSLRAMFTVFPTAVNCVIFIVIERGGIAGVDATFQPNRYSICDMSIPQCHPT
jgi:hypothetical protein